MTPGERHCTDPTGGSRPPRLLAICAGPATRLRGTVTGRTVDVLSGIVKRPLSVLDDPLEVEFGPLGVAGDEQADLTVHGGLDKAVYVYPVEHYAAWAKRAARAGIDFSGRPGSFGENLLVEGLLESDVWIGDRLEIGELVLAVTMPRRPCYKLDLHLYEGAGREMVLARQPGWYCAVVRPGKAAAGQPIRRRAGSRAYTIDETHRRQYRLPPVGPEVE
ncbi:MAG: MOSC domain-containing protein [Gemmatimonadales bacterium]|nr:MOSC domain-containing protein [Gemmatimonadales bacterium]